MRNGIPVCLLVLFVVLALRGFGPSGVATDVKNSEIQAVAQSDLTLALSDRALRVVDIEGKYQVGLAVVHRTKTTGPDSSSAMEQERYYRGISRNFGERDAPDGRGD